MKQKVTGNLYECIAKWLDIYHSTKNAELKSAMKDSIVSSMIPVVKNIARQIARRATDPIDDLIQAGFIGLLKAIDNYSKTRNDNFRVYAGYLILGEMKHYLRDRLTAIRVPRHIRELLCRINNYTSTLTPEELNVITSEEVAYALNVTPQNVDFALQIDRRCKIASLDDMYSEGSKRSFEEFIIDDDYKDKENLLDEKLIFNEIIDYLPPDQKVIIEMHYVQDMSKRDISKMLNLNEMKVNRMIKAALNTLYYYYENNHAIVIDDKEAII